MAERLSRGRSFRRRLPKEFGGCEMYVTPEAGLSYYLGIRRTANGLLSSVNEMVQPADVIWDVGANMGLFTFAAAGIAGPRGRVYAFEPDTELVALLRRSSMLNPRAAPVDVIPCAVAENNSVARFHIANRSRATNFLDGFGSSQTGGVRESQTVLTVSLDWMIERVAPPDVLKIDVEGAELGVFRGASCLLKTRRPIILFESCHNTRDELSCLLHDSGYVLYDADLPTNERKPLAVAAFNTLAKPA